MFESSKKSGMGQQHKYHVSQDVSSHSPSETIDPINWMPSTDLNLPDKSTCHDFIPAKQEHREVCNCPSSKLHLIKPIATYDVYDHSSYFNHPLVLRIMNDDTCISNNTAPGSNKTPFACGTLINRSPCEHNPVIHLLPAKRRCIPKSAHGQTPWVIEIPKESIFLATLLAWNSRYSGSYCRLPHRMAGYFSEWTLVPHFRRLKVVTETFLSRFPSRRRVRPIFVISRW